MTAERKKDLTGRPLRKVVLFGGAGLLGTALRPTLSEAGIEVIAPSIEELDIRDDAGVNAYVVEHDPDIVLNVAAQANVNRAEAEPEEAYQINAIGAQNIALAAAAQKIPVLHTSTDYVFSGVLNRPYREVDPTGMPAGHYAQSKLLGEQLVRQSSPEHFIVRVAALFGPGRDDFVDWVLQNADPAKPLTIVSDRYVSPTWTVDCARQVLALITTPRLRFWGTYHATGHGVASWYDLAHATLECRGLDPAGAVPIADKDFPSPAPRPAFSALENHLLRLRGLDTMLPWREALETYLKS